MDMLLMLGLVFLIMYFTMIRPQVKKQKEQNKFRNEIKAGTKIVTIGGIHGKVTDVKETTVIIDTGNGNKLKVERQAISMDSTVALEQ